MTRIEKVNQTQSIMIVNQQIDLRRKILNEMSNIPQPPKPKYLCGNTLMAHHKEAKKYLLTRYQQLISTYQDFNPLLIGILADLQNKINQIDQNISDYPSYHQKIVSNICHELLEEI